mmetsp:Transcript_85378/g.187486  ORF Transcript_85378/g.187486 Transcript_85378/m.187486 type:complete len:202 (+) Transcript_85378:1577-2182(+)
MATECWLVPLTVKDKGCVEDGKKMWRTGFDNSPLEGGEVSEIITYSVDVGRRFLHFGDLRSSFPHAFLCCFFFGNSFLAATSRLTRLGRRLGNCAGLRGCTSLRRSTGLGGCASLPASLRRRCCFRRGPSLALRGCCASSSRSGCSPGPSPSPGACGSWTGLGLGTRTGGACGSTTPRSCSCLGRRATGFSHESTTRTWAS